MVDEERLKNTLVILLSGMEKVSSFAATMNPLFNIVTSMLRLAQRGLASADAHKFDQDFSAIHTKLNTISQTNQQALRQIRLDEVNETYGKYEEYIKHQYAALNAMLERVRSDPEGSQLYMKEFEEVYERDKSELGLEVLYRGIIKDAVFGRPLLEVYFKHCSGSRSDMEARCSHLVHLFRIGLMSLMAYTSVTEDDEDQVREKWAPRVEGIQAKMEDVLRQCGGN